MFRRIREKEYKAFISASSATDLFYIAKKEAQSTSEAYRLLERVFDIVSILTVSEENVIQAFRMRLNDFEDCLQYMVAKDNKIEVIVTGNGKDFEKADISVVTPEKCLEMLNAEQESKAL